MLARNANKISIFEVRFDKEPICLKKISIAHLAQTQTHSFYFFLSFCFFLSLFLSVSLHFLTFINPPLPNSSSHLPLGCEFHVVEIDLTPLISPRTRAAFADELKKRSIARHRRKQAEQKRDREVCEMCGCNAICVYVCCVL